MREECSGRRTDGGRGEGKGWREGGGMGEWVRVLDSVPNDSVASVRVVFFGVGFTLSFESWLFQQQTL